MGGLDTPLTIHVDDFDGIQHQWEEILPFCSTKTIFVTPRWQRMWWRHFGDGSELRLLSAHRGDEVVGVAPLMLNAGVLSFLGDDDLFDYHDFLVRAGTEEVFYGALWDYLVDLEWQTMDLTGLPEGSPTLRYLPIVAQKAGIHIELTEQDTTPVVNLPASWEEYVAALRKKDRHELRRKLRRLEEADALSHHSCDSHGPLRGCLEDFFRLMRASSPEKDAFLTPGRERFFGEVVSELAPRGEIKLFFLEVGGARVASCMCIDYDDSYLLYNSGYDPEYSSLSVGLVNNALCIRKAIDRGKRSFNFLKGTERYKYDLGGKDQAVIRLSLRR